MFWEEKVYTPQDFPQKASRWQNMYGPVTVLHCEPAFNASGKMGFRVVYKEDNNERWKGEILTTPLSNFMKTFWKLDEFTYAIRYDVKFAHEIDPPPPKSDIKPLAIFNEE